MSGYQIEITPKADGNLDEIADYIALDNPERAFSFISEIYAFIKTHLAMFPKAGTLFDEDTGTRMIPYGRYNIYYRVFDKIQTVEILYIRHSARLN